MLLLAVFLLAQFVVFPLVAGYHERLGLVAAEFTILWMLFVFIRHQGWIAEDLLLLNAIGGRVLFGSLLAGVGASLMIAEFDLLLARLLERADLAMPLALQRELLEIQLVGGLGEIPAAAAAVVVSPGICEEAFFRGFVFVTLAARLGARIAVPASAVLFAAVHLNPWQFPALFLFGLFLAGLVYWSHSLYPAVIAHFINNALSLIGVNARVHLGVDGLASAELLPLPVLIGALALLVMGIRYVRSGEPIMPLLSPYAPAR